MKKKKKKNSKKYNEQSKKEIARLKSLYKKGKLKFDSKKIAESILDDPYFRRGIAEKFKPKLSSRGRTK